MNKTAIVGTRTYTNYEEFKTILSLREYDHIVTGDASGTDAMARQYAKENNIPLTVHVADWNKHGKAAGPIRNTLIVNDADELIAFWNTESLGTADSLKKANLKNIPTYIIAVGVTTKQ